MIKRIIDFIRSLFILRRNDEGQTVFDEVIVDFTDHASKTKSELTDLARELGLSGYSRLNKGDLIALIETSEVL